MTDPAPPDSGWKVEATLKPQAAVSPPQPEKPDVLTPPPPWLASAGEVRTVVKWLIGAFAAVGAVLFAKGFVTTPTLSWTANRGQLTLAWIAGVLALLAVGWLIYKAVDILRPTLYELADLPPDYVSMLNGNPHYYLPSDATSVADFVDRLDETRSLETEWRHEAEVRELALKQARETADQPTINAAELELKKATATHASLVRRLDVYNRARGHLLDRAAYWKSSRGLDVSAGWMVLAATVAAAGGIGYQLLLASPDKPEEEPATAAAPVVVGELIRTDTEAGLLLWDRLSLADCQSDEATFRILVVVSEGKGTSPDPYVVTTIPTGTCRAITFTVINEVALVDRPETDYIRYTPAPSSTATEDP